MNKYTRDGHKSESPPKNEKVKKVKKEKKEKIKEKDNKEAKRVVMKN